MHAGLRDGSLRKAATERGVPVVLYEAGEALRFDEWAIRGGLLGVVSAMQRLQMIPLPRKPRTPSLPLVAEKNH
jgi:predicted deacylase